MSEYVELQTEDGEMIRVEVKPSGEVIDASISPMELAGRAKASFENAFETVRITAKTFITKVHSLSDPPDEVELEFGLKVDATAGTLVANAGTEAQFKIILTWKRPG